LTVTAWRITKRRHARTAFSGDGARLYGGRWNNPGTSIVYVAESQALAVLEVLVHLDSSALLEKYVLIQVDFEDSLMSDLSRTALPKNWGENPVPPSVQAVGDRWIAAGSTAVLRVPSALVPGESNFLINPRHADFPKLKISKPKSFRFDPRLVGDR
jgi:RES domain-containing protein